MAGSDPYPSRVGGEARLLPRLDPVVHGPGPGGLDPELRGRYERGGFLSFRRLLDADAVEALARRARELLEAARTTDSPKVIREPGSDEVRSVFEVHRDDAVFREVACHPRLRGIAEDVLGGPVYVHQSRINYKPAFRGRPFHWHSDFETWHVEDGMPRMRALSFSINLTENRAENGPLMVIPGSHHQYLACPGRTPEHHYERSLRRQEAGVPPEQVIADLAGARGIASPTGPPGSATLFDCNLLHGSNGNISPFARTNLFLVFNSVENTLGAPFSGQPPRPDYVASRHFDAVS